PREQILHLTWGDLLEAIGGGVSRGRSSEEGRICGWSEGPKNQGTELEEELEIGARSEPESQERQQRAPTWECGGNSGAAATTRSGGTKPGALRTFRRRAMYETLMEAAVTEENCQQALKAKKCNRGAGGIDRMTTEELEPHLQAHGWILKDKIVKGTYVA